MINRNQKNWKWKHGKQQKRWKKRRKQVPLYGIIHAVYKDEFTLVHRFSVLWGHFNTPDGDITLGQNPKSSTVVIEWKSNYKKFDTAIFYNCIKHWEDYGCHGVQVAGWAEAIEILKLAKIL